MSRSITHYNTIECNRHVLECSVIFHQQSIDPLSLSDLCKVVNEMKNDFGNYKKVDHVGLR